MGRLIVLEGTDGSGKSTQFARLKQRLQVEGRDFRTMVFPRYSEESSALIRLYLGGAFGSAPGDVNAYAASTFYAVDRFASYKQDWGTWYEAGGLMLADRYTTSNAVHQAPKLPPEERAGFLKWLEDLEYTRMGLPRPDLVLLLDMPIDLAAQLRAGREADTGTSADIHERDNNYLAECRRAALQTAELSGWKVIPCAAGSRIRTIEEIHEEIYEQVSACLKG